MKKIMRWLLASTLYCSNCGHPNPSGTTYCQSCGKMLNP